MSKFKKVAGKTMLKGEFDMGFAFDLISIKQVKYDIAQTDASKEEFEFHSDQIRRQLKNYLAIINSKFYKDLYEANKAVYHAVDLAKKNQVTAFYVDYLNWTRWILKQKLQEHFDGEPLSEIKIGYDNRYYLQANNSFHLILFDKEDKEYIEKTFPKGFCMHHDYAILHHMGKLRYVPLHRTIMEKAGFNLENKSIDHINRCKFDNRKSNLRVCTKGENNRNKVNKTNNPSGFPGVLLHKNKKSWKALVTHEGIRYYVTHFTTIREAAICRDLLAKKYHKEFATKSILDPSKEEIEKAQNLINTKLKIFKI